MDSSPSSGRLWVYGASMLRRRARVGHLPPAVPLSSLLLALALVLSGCGGSGGEKKADEPSKAAVACRGEWKKLEAEIDGRDSKTNPSALASRWNNITATVEYYARSASAKDCDATLAAQQKAMDSLAAFSTKVAPWDMEQRYDEVKTAAAAYAAAPRPTLPTPSTKAGKRAEKKPPKPKPNPAPRPADIGTALKTLSEQAPVATQQQGPAWVQASVTELTDPAAVAKAVKDLAFLSTESAAYRTCAAALAQIKVALAQPKS
ncbi:MAG: hypothetical protein JWR90_730 [Marmoricola sp.]|jgi:hypothetical protein|nr:hypothetical protein [Marmoricola sp.]